MKSVLRIRGALLLLFLFFTFTNVEAKTDAGNPEVLGLMKKISGLQIPFIENQGQIKPVLSKAEGAESVRFYANTFAGTVFITDKGEIVYSLIKSELRTQSTDKRQNLSLRPRIEFGGSNLNPAQSEILNPKFTSKAIALKETLAGLHQSVDNIKGINRSETKVNYFVGAKESWRTNVSTWQEVSLGEVYNGIELKLRAYGNNIEKFFTIHPKGSVEDIKLKLEGAKSLRINENGELEVETEIGTVKFTKPVAYQEEKIPSPLAPACPVGRGEGKGEGALQNKQYIKVAYVVDGNEYGFQVAEYDRTKPLIIDPTLVYSTYLGGGSAEYGYGIAVDSSGNIYVSGKTNSIEPSPFPTTGSAYQGSNAGGYDIFVAKIDASGSSLVYSTYLGGSGEDSGCGSMTIDGSGNVYLTGFTKSTTDFPTTASAYQGSYGGGTQDAFVTKIDASGSELIYSTYLGGSGFDYPCGWSIAVDSSGNAYVVGETGSTDFPTTGSAYQGSNAGGYDAFITKINASGSELIYSTYLGGVDDDASWAIDIDSSGNAYISGFTKSTDFPTASPIYGDQTGMDAFAAKINTLASGTESLVYSTYLGGGGSIDYAHGIAVDSSGNAYVTGRTNSTGLSPFPTTGSAYQGSYGGGSIDAFVTKINAAGTALVYSTYLGGDGLDYGWGIVVDSSENAYLTGYTDSTNFPTACPTYGDQAGRDVFVTKINTLASGTESLVYSTYLGGGGTDEGWDIAVDSSGNAYVTGRTNSTGSSPFPTTASAYQGSNAGGFDAFVAKISSDGEVCDGVDNDCNGLIDDGIPSTPTTCGIGACASTGTLSCVGGALVDTCTPGTPSAETCNGIDDDCDGLVDDGIPSTPTTCGVGACASTGTLSCVNGQIVDSCVAGSPTAEVCDGIDNNCNGVVDDGIPSTPTTCGVGACASTGTLSCVGGALVDTCTPGTPSAEICDGIDNDCDGAVDDGILFVRIGTTYYSSLQTAYDSAGEGSVIQTQDIQLIENLSSNLSKTVTIDGGYDCSYAIKTGKTQLKGQMTISNGKVTVKDFILEK